MTEQQYFDCLVYAGWIDPGALDDEYQEYLRSEPNYDDDPPTSLDYELDLEVDENDDGTYTIRITHGFVNQMKSTETHTGHFDSYEDAKAFGRSALGEYEQIMRASLSAQVQSYIDSKRKRGVAWNLHGKQIKQSWMV